MRFWSVLFGINICSTVANTAIAIGSGSLGHAAVALSVGVLTVLCGVMAVREAS